MKRVFVASLIVVGLVIAVVYRSLWLAKEPVRRHAENLQAQPRIVGHLYQGMLPADCEKIVGSFGIANIPVFTPVEKEWSDLEFWFVRPVELSSSASDTGLQAVTQRIESTSIFVFPSTLQGVVASGRIIEIPD